MRRCIKPLALAFALVVPVACTRGGEDAKIASARATRTLALERNPASANDGARVYATNCQSCHQSDGRGVPGAFPPLAGNPRVTGGPDAVIAAVKYGMSGKIRVGGESYDGTMPRWGQMISDDEIAAVVSYIRTTWHNRAAPVSLADVKNVTQEFR